MNMNQKYVKVGLILVAILATVTISGCIGDSNEFTKEANVEGVTFHVPSDYNLENTQDNGINKEYTYSDGTNNILFFYYPGASLDLILSQMKDTPAIFNIKENVTYGGITGHSAEGSTSKIFVFEKSGKTFAIEMSSSLDFEEYVPKILGK